MSRRRFKRGRHLKTMSAQVFLDRLDDLSEKDSRWRGEGWTRKPTVRPYLRMDGRLTVEFVWRKSDDVQLTMSHRLTFRLPPGFLSELRR